MASLAHPFYPHMINALPPKICYNTHMHIVSLSNTAMHFHSHLMDKHDRLNIFRHTTGKVRNPTKDPLISGQSALPPEAKLPQHNTNVHLFKQKQLQQISSFCCIKISGQVCGFHYVNVQCCYSEFAHLHRVPQEQLILSQLRQTFP